MTLILSADLINATVKKVTAAHGTYGDRSSESLGTAYDCRFRDFATVEDGERQTLDSDAQVWADTAAGLAENNVIEVTPNDGTAAKRFRVIRVGHARGAGNQVQFDKIDLARYHG